MARARAFIDSYSPTATVTGWTRPLPEDRWELWSPGEIVMVHAPSAFIVTPSRLVIRRVTMQLDETNGQITQLDLGIPEGFDQRTPERFPWQL